MDQESETICWVQNHLLMKKISWKFNPPTASHMGGIWERHIRNVRKVLDGILTTQVLEDERLETLFCEVESIVNGRPITPVSSDPTDAEALTPNHLLLLRTGSGAADLGTVKEAQYGRRWRHVQYLTNIY